MAFYQSSNSATGSGRQPFHPTNQLGFSGYIINLNTTMVINFTTAPDTINETVALVMNSMQIQGRSDPLYYYSSSGPRNVTFTLPLIDEMTPYGLVYTVNQIKALVYPRYVGYVIEPPKTYLRIGNFITLIGFCENVNVTWKPPVREDIYSYADVSLTFTQATVFPYDTVQVEQNAESNGGIY